MVVTRTDGDFSYPGVSKGGLGTRQLLRNRPFVSSRRKTTSTQAVLQGVPFTPEGPFRTVFSTESASVVFYYSVVNLLRIVMHYSKHSKSVLKL